MSIEELLKPAIKGFQREIGIYIGRDSKLPKELSDGWRKLDRIINRAERELHAGLWSNN